MTDDTLRKHFEAVEQPMRQDLERIGSTIGYGRACQILGELWDDMLVRVWGLPRGRGRMERRRDMELAEAAIIAERTRCAAIARKHGAEDAAREIEG